MSTTTAPADVLGMEITVLVKSGRLAEALDLARRGWRDYPTAVLPGGPTFPALVAALAAQVPGGQNAPADSETDSTTDVPVEPEMDQDQSENMDPEEAAVQEMAAPEDSDSGVDVAQVQASPEAAIVAPVSPAPAVAAVPVGPVLTLTALVIERDPAHGTVIKTAWRDSIKAALYPLGWKWARMGHYYLGDRDTLPDMPRIAEAQAALVATGEFAVTVTVRGDEPPAPAHQRKPTKRQARAAASAYERAADGLRWVLQMQGPKCTRCGTGPLNVQTGMVVPNGQTGSPEIVCGGCCGQVVPQAGSAPVAAPAVPVSAPPVSAAPISAPPAPISAPPVPATPIPAPPAPISAPPVPATPIPASPAPISAPPVPTPLGQGATAGPSGGPGVSGDGAVDQAMSAMMAALRQMQEQINALTTQRVAVPASDAVPPTPVSAVPAMTAGPAVAEIAPDSTADLAILNVADVLKSLLSEQTRQCLDLRWKFRVQPGISSRGVGEALRTNLRQMVGDWWTDARQGSVVFGVSRDKTAPGQLIVFVKGVSGQVDPRKLSRQVRGVGEGTKGIAGLGTLPRGDR